MPDVASGNPKPRAAQYLRMSTEHQNYSIHHQGVAIAAYAGLHGIEIVRTYTDEGISGLLLHNRPGLKRLLADVLSGQADFDLILTYDVSRWGRFQDPDQSAHYEFLCREAGVRIEYCAEPFCNDGSVTASIVKQLKRVMAAEYSRELAVKVSTAQRNFAGLGYWVGGPPGFALRRQIVHRDGALGPTLQLGQQKWVKTDHVVLVPGPAEEVALVQRIYRLFVISGMSRKTISRTLNAEGLAAADGALWTPDRVHEVLTNEKYAGVQVIGRAGGRLLKAKRPREACAQATLKFEPMVGRACFDLAQRCIARRIRLRGDDAMIAGLKTLLAEQGRLSRRLINEDERIPCAQTYQHRFGSLLEAYRRVGFDPGTRAAAASARHGVRYRQRRRTGPVPDNAELLEMARTLLSQAGSLSMRILDDAPGLPPGQVFAQRFGSLGTLYDLVGYTPTYKQAKAMSRMTGRGRWV